MASQEILYVVRVRDEATKQLRSVQDAAVAATAAFGAMILLTKQAVDFESSFAGIRKTVNLTEVEFGILESKIRSLSKAIPVNVNQLNRIGEMAGQLGVAGVDNLEKFIDTVAKISVTTNLTEESAATSFARISNIMQEPLTNIDRMASSVVSLGNNFATTESEIVEFANRIAGSGKIAGLTTAEIFGIGAAFSSVGIQAEAGGTAVQKVLFDLTKEGKRGPQEFLKFVQNLSDSGTKAAQVLEELGFSDSRLQTAFLSVAGAGGILEKALTNSTKAFAENTALTEEAQKRFATFASQLVIAQNRVRDIAITIGSEMLPVLLKVLYAIEPYVLKMAEWIEENEKMVGIIAVVVMGLSGLIVALGAAALAITSMTTVVTGLGAALAFLSGPVGLVIAGVVALGVAWQQNLFGMRDATESFAYGVQALVATAQLAWEGLEIALAAVWKIIEELFKAGMQAIQGDWVGAWTTMEGIPEKVMGSILQSVASKAEAIIGKINEIKSALKSAAEEAIIGGVTFMSPGAGEKLTQARDFMSGIPGRAGGGTVNEPMTLVGEKGPELVSLPKGSFVHTAAETSKMLEGAARSVETVGSNIQGMPGLIDSVSVSLSAMSTIMSSAWTQAETVSGSAMTHVSELVNVHLVETDAKWKTMWLGVNETTTAAMTALKVFMQETWDEITLGFDSSVEAMAAKVYEFINGPIGDFIASFEQIRNMAQTLESEMRSSARGNTSSGGVVGSVLSSVGSSGDFRSSLYGEDAYTESMIARMGQLGGGKEAALLADRTARRAEGIATQSAAAEKAAREIQAREAARQADRIPEMYSDLSAARYGDLAKSTGTVQTNTMKASRDAALSAARYGIVARAGGGRVNEPWTLVGEEGPELVSLPRGSNVHTAGETKGMMGGISLSVTVQGSVIGLSKRELIDMLGGEIMRLLKPSLNHA